MAVRIFEPRWATSLAAAAVAVAILALGTSPVAAQAGCDPLVDFCEDPVDFTTYYAEDLYTEDPYDPYLGDPYTHGGSSADGWPLTLPFADIQAVDAYDASTLASVRSRRDLSDDVDVDDVAAIVVPELTAARMVLVIDALAELGAFRRVDDIDTTFGLRFIRDLVPPDGLTDDGYRAEVARFSAQLRPAIRLLQSDGVQVSPALERIGAALTPELLESLESGRTALIDPGPWLNGLSDLVARGGAAPINPAYRVDDQEAVMAVVAAVAGVAIERDSGITGGEGFAPGAASNGYASQPTYGLGGDDFVHETVESSSSTAGPIAVGVALAVAGLVLLLVRRRSGRVVAVDGGSPDPKLSVNDLLDASRRMTASLDVSEIGRIVVAEARRLVAAEGGIIVLHDGTTLSPIHHEPAALFEPSALTDEVVASSMGRTGQSCLLRVVETGQATIMVSSDEPALVEVPMALLAVPIVVDSRVAGAILVVRVSSRPFDRGDLEALEMLAPMVGSALNAAATHGSATALAAIEPLTGLKNRRRLDEDFLALAGGPDVAFIMIDVDHFKLFNDTNGHSAGDEALRQVAAAMESNVRPGDLAYRYGGEEFCILLPDATEADALTVAERVRSAVEACEIPGGGSQPEGRVTVSVGVAWSGPAGTMAERADAALYEAKRDGRNRVRSASHSTGDAPTVSR